MSENKNIRLDAGKCPALSNGDEINFPSRRIDLGRIRSLRLPVRSQITKVDGIASYFDIFGI